MATLRLDIVDEAVMFQTVPLLKETLVVEVASVCIAPVSVEALALKAIALPFVALRRSPAPALAIVLLKLTEAVDALAKIKSPEALPMLKLSKVATALVALEKSIAFAAADTVPPPEAMIEGDVPLNVKAEDDDCEVVTLSAPDAATEPDSACTPVDRGPETAMDVGP